MKSIIYLLSTKVNTTSSKILPVLPPPIGTQTIKLQTSIAEKDATIRLYKQEREVSQQV